jgi:hypothetical protein
MIYKSTLAVILILLSAFEAHGQSQRNTLKGYELYSWQRDGKWYYSLLPATNRSKTYQEIMSEQVARQGTKAIRAELSKLQRGETVIWKSEGSPGIEKPADRNHLRLSHPKGKKVRKIMKHCESLGLKLQLA